MFEAYVTNLGLYPERGAGAGTYLKFPTTVEEVQALFSRIGIPAMTSTVTKWTSWATIPMS